MGIVIDNIVKGNVLMHSHNMDVSDISIKKLGSPTYTTLEEWINTTQSVGKISGGGLTDNGDGTVAVSNGTGLIRATNDDTAQILSIDWSNDSSVSLVDNSVNYIYVRYNSGSPDVISSTTLPSDKNTDILLGLAYRNGTDIHIITAGQLIANYPAKTLWKDIEINGKFQRVNGLILGEKSDRKISITSGYIYAGLTKLSIPAFDSSVSDTFTSIYRDGSGDYTYVTGQTQIDNTHWDDGSGTLATLSNPLGWRSYYGVHWVYQDAGGHVFVLYGRGDYLLSDAENTQPPSDIPDLLSNIGGLIGRIIIEKDATSLTEIKSAFNVVFIPSVASEHNVLAGLQGGTTDEYYHLTEDEHTEATRDATNTQNGLMPTGKLDNWDDAYTHTTSNGTDHTYINQDVQTTASPTFANVYVPDGGFMGVSGEDGWTFDSTNGDISTMSNVGIGVSPTYLLDLYRSSNGPTRIRISNPNTGNNAWSDFYIRADDGAGGLQGYAIQMFGKGFTSTWDSIPMGGYARFRSETSVSGLVFTTGGNSPLIFGTQDNERLRILGNGNVGIGTAGPASQLEVNGGCNIGGANAVSDNNLYVTNNCSAASFTDRTPYYEGDALAEIKAIKSKDGKKEIDHSSLPVFAQKELRQGVTELVEIEQEVKDEKGETILDENKKPVTETVTVERQKYDENNEPIMETVVERDIGAMVSILTVAVQQISDKLDKLELLI